jgi:hypothetical protein
LAPGYLGSIAMATPLQANGPVDRNGALNGGFWLNRFDAYRKAHPNLTPEQMEVLGEVEKFVQNPRPGLAMDLEASALNAFGRDEASSLFVDTWDDYSYGSQTSKRWNPCGCSTESDWCGVRFRGHCVYRPAADCQPTWVGGCGWLNQYQCNGDCSG